MDFEVNTTMEKILKVNNLDFGHLEKAIIVLQGDPHVGSREFAEKEFRRDVEWALDTKSYWINMGDALETATRNSVGAGVYEQEEILEEQLDSYVKLVMPLVSEGLFLGSHPGNHEERAYKESGINPAKIISKLTGTKYFGAGILHNIHVGDFSYALYTTHGNSGARLPHTKIKVCMDIANMIDADIYGIGHLHTISYSARQFYRMNKRNKTLDRVERHFVITGAYLYHWGSYAHRLNIEPAKIGSAKIKLHGREHMVRVSI